MDPPSLHLTIELVRSQDGADRYHFDFTAQKYKRRVGPGTYQESQLPWSQRVLDALKGLHPRRRNPEDAQYLGDLLRAFLAPLGWDADERELERALKAGREVHLTLRFAAAELYALPWELVTLRNSRRHLGALPGCHIRYEAPRDEEPFELSPAPPVEEGRLLFAWSAAGGDVPLGEHFTAIQSACKRSSYPFDPRADMVDHVSLAGLERVLKESQKPVAALHILCHGGPRGQVYGLHWNPADAGAEADLIDAATLRELLAPYSESLRLVVLCACTSGDSGALDSHLGGVAQGLHAIGIRAVIASRLPLSVDGSHQLTKTLYEHLLVRHTSLQQALVAARAELKLLATTLDWASLQLYARQDEPLQQFPFVFRPYQGLLPFEQEHRAFFFGRGAQQQQWLVRLREAARGERPRLQVLAGPSGSGKSSLAKAAILPALGVEGWEVVSKRAVEPGLLGELQRLGTVPPQGHRLLLVDQFEEIFARPAAEHEPFARALWRLSRADEARTVVLLTLRLDALERCAKLRLDEAGTLLSTIVLDPRHHSFLPPLQADEYREVIAEPANGTGLCFEPGLIEQMVQDAGQEPGALPLLEHALDLLWERRQGYMLTQAAYHALGGLTGALTRTVDLLYEQLSPAEQHQMRRLLVELVDFRDDRALATRRREMVARLRPVEPLAREAFGVVVERLVSQRLLVRGDDPEDEADGAWLEVAHEALIRRWDRLGQWLREEGDRILALRTLRGWAREWAMHRNDPDGGTGYLPFGSRLTYVRELREKYPQDTATAPEKEFLAAAEAADRQRDAHFLKSIRIANRLLVDIGGLEGMAGLDEQHRSLLEQVQQMLDNLIQSVGAHPKVQRVKSVACIELGKAALEHGNWDEAWEMYQSALRISQGLCERVPSDCAAQEQLAVSHDRLGLLARRQGDLDQALEHNREAIQISERLLREQPSEVRFQILLARVLRHAGELMLARKDLDLAQANLERAFALLQALHGAGLASPKHKLRLVSCLLHLGELATAQDSPALTEKHYRAALGILETVPVQPAASRTRLMFAELYSRLGRLDLARGNMPEALRRHLNALHLLEALAEAQPRNMDVLLRLTISLRNLGEVKRVEGDLEDARFYLSHAQSKIETLLTRAPTHTEYLVEEFLAELQLGKVARALGDMAALTTHEASAEEILGTFEQTRVSRDLIDSLRAKLKQLQDR